VHEISLGWRSRSRIVLAGFATFVAGILAATAGAPVVVRLPAAVLFVVGAGLVVDATVFAASWRSVPAGIEVPSLLARRRSIAGRPDLVVELREGRVSRLVVTGARGARSVRANPLVSGRDLRRWWNAIPDPDSASTPER
jgi:hypothetical protein